MTKIPSSNQMIFWIIAAAVAVFVYFFGLSIPLLGPDEPRYSQVAREMFERGDWVTPTLGGFHWFEKPALLYWLQISSYNIFGVSEFSARLGSAILGLGTVTSLWMLGRTIREHKPEFAQWLALIAASSLGLIVFARGASFDIILTFPMTAAMVSFFVFDRKAAGEGSGSQILPLAAFYFFVGVSLLAKGLVGAVFPFAIIIFYFLISRRLPNRVFLLSLVWGGLLTLAVAATWYWPMYQQNGWKFIDEFFIQHHFQRYTSNKYFHPQPFYFFLWVLPLMTLPWLPFFFDGIWRFLKDLISKVKANSAQQDLLPQTLSPLFLYSIAWLLVPLVFFSFSGSKLPGYILPALPPALVITTFSVLGFISGNEFRSRVIRAIAIATFVVVTAMLIFVVPRFAETDSVKGLIRAADVRGHSSLKVMTLYTVSHNAEFYAPGRLIRDGVGKQRQLNNTGELVESLRKENAASALVIYPLRLQKHVLESNEINAEVIKDNGEYVIALVTPKL